VISRRKQTFEAVAKTNYFPSKFSEARTTPRKTAFSPGQSPPLSGCRSVASFVGAIREFFLDRPGDGRRPLIVICQPRATNPAPSPNDRAAEQNYNDMARINRGAFALLDNFASRLAERMRHSPARRSDLFSLHRFVRTEKFVRVAQHVAELARAA